MCFCVQKEESRNSIQLQKSLEMCWVVKLWTSSHGSILIVKIYNMPKDEYKAPKDEYEMLKDSLSEEMFGGG